jgi:hypothetical protein
MSKPNREPFRNLTPAQQRASIAGGEAATKAKKRVYQEMKQRQQEEQREYDPVRHNSRE